MKIEWKKTEKHLYLPGEIPGKILVPPMKFLAISGEGDPNRPEFSEEVGVLYSLAYAVRMMPKSGFVPEGYAEYTVYPLEGIWSLVAGTPAGKPFSKASLAYIIMIRQPDFVNGEVLDRAFETVRKKKNPPLLSRVSFREFDDGLCVQMLHRGPFDEEPRSFAAMEAWMAGQGLARRNKDHREIYLSDFNKCKPADLKTVLRLFVEPAAGGGNL